MWLGIDIGTGSSRALLVDERGAVRATCTAVHEDMLMERPLWAEQRPENWWDAAVQAIRGVLAQAAVHGSQIKGIGLSGQMHGLVILDGAHQVIRPSLIWCDQRSQKQVDAVNEKVGRENILRYIANPVLTGFTLPKLLWVRDNEPDNFDRVRKMLLPKDYVRFKLTGEFASEVSDASGTAVFDVVNRRWSFEMMDALGLDRDILPTCYESSDVTGAISREVAELTGLAAGTPVVGGGGDQAASAVGNGIVEPGIVSCTLGTSGVVFAHMENVAYDPGGRVHTFCHAVAEKWHVMGVTQGAGLSLQWFRNQLAAGAKYDALMQEAADSPAGAQGLFWLPYLMGERTPHLDATARGGWVGLTNSHRRADLIRSVIEGVSYSQLDCLEIIEALGIEVNSVRASGGGAQSPIWRGWLSSVLNKRVVTLESQEGSAYGAALLALAGTGAYTSVPEVCRVAIRETESVSPVAADAAFYKKGHRIYQSLYTALKPVYAEIAAL
ncbi:MAG TPA: xylulokinase [Candidatus Sulfopaludibacter sp.]|jgi:xylulokinase|nr:xylulokinase [Candidatus Sulfopaludibacter sp.]